MASKTVTRSIKTRYFSKACEMKVWNWRVGRAANQATFTCVEFGNSNKWIKLLNKDNFMPSNRKSPLNKLFEQFVKQRRHFLPGQCQKNQWDCTFLTFTAIWKIAIQVEAYFCKRRVRKILKRGSRTEFENWIREWSTKKNLNSERLRNRSPGAIYSYSEKGCRKKCARDNPER